MDELNALPAQTGLDRRALLQLTSGAVASAAVGAMATDSSAAAKAPKNLSDIVMMDARTLAAAIRARKLSAVEVMDAYLDHIEAINPKVNAIVGQRSREDLIAEARACDEQLARGGPLGVLHGLPHAVKDLQPAKGLRYTQGSPIFRDTVATTDSIMVERLRAAGAIIVGKTNTPEFGLGSHTYNPVYGITRNAYDQTRSAGGSSGGAAVALATRMLPLADGSDYGGSLRNPAGWNNVFGFRTSAGRVPVHGKEDWLPSMGVTGPMARNVGDLALLLSVQAGFDPRAPLAMESGGEQFRAVSKATVKGKRIGWLGDFGGEAPCEPGVLEVCRTALKPFEALGCEVADARVDYPVEKVWPAFIRLRGWQQGGSIAEYAADPARRSLLKPEAIWEIETGAKLSAFDVTAASTICTDWSQAVRRLFDRYDYLIAPTAQVFPFTAELHWPQEIAGKKMATYHEWMKGVCLITMSGCPSLACPAGLGPGGLPMGFQIIAPVHHEMDCLRLAAAYEAAAPLSANRLPPMLTGA
jgi:amidase